MNTHFTVTIHDDNGMQQYNLHNFVKKAIFYAVIFLASISFIAVMTILYLNYEVDAIDVKRIAMHKNYQEIELKNKELNENMNATLETLLTKKEELERVSQSLSDIETLIGLAPVEEMTLQERVDIAKLSSEDMATLLQFIPSGSPVPYAGIGGDFGRRIHPITGKVEYHAGTDMKADSNTPVHATADGIVEFAGSDGKSGYGNLVILQHNYGFKTYFAHLNKIVIKSGQFIKKGDLLAYSGNTGLTSGPHLHYEVKFMARVVNPILFIKWDALNYKEIFEKEKEIPWQSLIKATAHIKVPIPTQAQPSLLSAHP
ncbi:MAG: M23 family metallopeptidase [Campylobacterales bacterium]|nr:M23 family metallopeptidase [Campylobacterales bacterium]